MELRIIGNAPPSTSSFNSSYFTDISNLGVYYTGGSTNLIADSGFELQTTPTVSSPWGTEGPDPHGIKRNEGSAHSGENDAWIRDSTTNWNSMIQVIHVTPNTSYSLSGWIRNNFPSSSVGYFGVRAADEQTILGQYQYSSEPSYGNLTVTFNSGSSSTVTIFAGFWGTGSDQYIQLDDFGLTAE